MSDFDNLKQPVFVPDPELVPHPEQGQIATIRPGSGLAVIGLFVEIIRKRFGPENQLPWIWSDDIKQTKIAIESAFNEDTQVRNFRPAIFVDRDEQVVGRNVLGDFVGQQLKTGMEAFWALETVPILIECLAAKKAESAILADLVKVFLHASRRLIQGKFGLHEMTPVNIGRPQPAARDKQEWITPVTFSVQYNFRWTNTPTAPLLQEIIAAIQASSAGGATAFFEQIAIFGK
jgi:hypothetical protein